MGDIRGVIGWSFTGVGAFVFLLLAAPAGHAAGLGYGMQPPPGAEPPPTSGDPPTLTLAPATASAGALVKAVVEGFASCVAGDGEMKVSRSREVSLAATGGASLFWDGIDPVTIVHLDEELGLSANLQIAESAPPGDHRLVNRCVDNAGDDGGTGSADFPVPPMPPPVVAAVPERNPADAVAVDGTAPGAATAPSPTTPAVDTALAAPGNPDGASTAGTPPTPSGARIPAGNEGNRAIGAEPALSGTDPRSWGLLIGALMLVGTVLAVPLMTPYALQARRGPKWVRANVRAVAEVAPAMSVELVPPIDDSWPPTSIVRFDLHADSGTQTLTEVQQ